MAEPMNRIFIPGGKGGRGDLNYARSYPDFEIGDQLTLYQGAMSFADVTRTTQI
jgi:hypothetical protein